VDGAVINIGGGRTKSVKDVLRSVSEAMDCWTEPAYVPKRPGDVRHTKADIALAQELLGWKPEAEWEGSVRETVRWFTARGRTK
jgi:nucleoside-diphosphate-sugar epimerase